MLKDDLEILAELLSQIVSMSGSTFPAGCKKARVKPILKTGKIQKQRIIDLFHFCL